MNRTPEGRAFVDVVGKIKWRLGKGSIDENPGHRGFGFVRVQFAGAGWMYLPMRQWADATPLQQRPRYRAALHGDMRLGRAFNRPNQSTDDPATGHNILPTSPDLRPVRKLPLATGLPIILDSKSSIDLADAAATITKERLSC